MDQIQIKGDVDQKDANVCRFTVDRPVHSGKAVFNNKNEAGKNGLAHGTSSLLRFVNVRACGSAGKDRLAVPAAPAVYPAGRRG